MNHILWDEKVLSNELREDINLVPSFRGLCSRVYNSILGL